MKRAYPLEALRELRAAVREAAEQALARRAAEATSAADALAAAEVQVAEQRQGIAERRDAPPSPSSAASLRRAEAFVGRLERELSQLLAEAERCRQRLDAAQAAVSEAREALARAETDCELVERNRERWDAARRADEARRAEAELEDLVAARLHRGEH